MHQSWKNRWHRGVLLAACLLVLSACQSETLPPLDLPAGCNPLLAGKDCMLPFPSDFFLVDDATLPSGKRIEVTGAAVLTSIDDESANIYEVEAVDGFSLTPPIVAILGEPLSQLGLNTIFDEPTKTTYTNHPTLLVNAETLELIPHFVDLDPRATSAERQAMVIRPLVGLDEKTRYVVIVHGVQRLDGGTVQAPEGFRRIRDRQTRGDSKLEPLAKRYAKSIFPLIEELSLNREDIQLAWDFTTGSIEHVQRDMLDMRRLILSTIVQAPPAVEIQSVEIHEEGNAWKTIHGRVTVPLILDSDKPGSVPYRDESGRIALNGDVDVPFIAIIPRSVMNDSLPANIMQYGHGFFGTRSETNSAVTLAHETKSIVFGVDWWGLSRSDTGASISNLGGDVKNALQFSKRLFQAMGNWFTLSEAIRTSLKQEEVFHRPGGELMYDSSELTFVGMSLGAILGGTYTALNPSISKSVLHVGGVALAHMMFRSDPFSPFLFVLDMSLPDPLDQQKFVASLQPVCDRFDPSAYAPYLVNKALPIEYLPPARDRQIFMQIALADTQVPNFASFLYGRLAGIPLVEPSPIDIFGMETVPGPFEGSGMVVVDLGEDPSFALKAEPPGPLNNVHTSLRGRDDAIRQMLTFLEDGVIEVE